MIEVVHGTASVCLEHIERTGYFRHRSWFMPVDACTIGEMEGHAVRAACRFGGIPVLLTLEVPDDLLVPSPESLRRWFRQPDELCSTEPLSASMIVDVDTEVFAGMWSQAKDSRVVRWMFPPEPVPVPLAPWERAQAAERERVDAIRARAGLPPSRAG